MAQRQSEVAAKVARVKALKARTEDADWETISGGDDDWEDVSASHGASGSWDQPVQVPTMTRQLMGIDPLSVGDKFKGAAQSIGKTALGAVQWGENVAGLPVTPTPPFLEPKNPAQEVGNKVGQFAQVAALPSGAATVPGRVAQAAVGGIGGGLATQGTDSEPMAGAVAGAAMPLVSNTIGEVGKAISRKMSQAANDWMQVHPKWMEHGADPGKRLVDEGILGGTREEVKQQVDDKLTEVGKYIKVKLAQAGTQAFDAEPVVINSLDQATKRIGLRTDQAFQKQLDSILDDILHDFPNLKSMPPAELHALKVRIGDSIKWTGQPYEGDINQVLIKMYGGMNDIIKSNVPGIGTALTRYGDLKVAQNALKESILKEAAGKDVTRGLGSAMVKKVVPQTVKRVAVGTGVLGAGYTGKKMLGY